MRERHGGPLSCTNAAADSGVCVFNIAVIKLDVAERRRRREKKDLAGNRKSVHVKQSHFLSASAPHKGALLTNIKKVRLLHHVAI